MRVFEQEMASARMASDAISFPRVVQVLDDHRCVICSLAVVLKPWLDNAGARRRQKFFMCAPTCSSW